MRKRYWIVLGAVVVAVAAAAGGWLWMGSGLGPPRSHATPAAAPPPWTADVQSRDGAGERLLEQIETARLGLIAVQARRSQTPLAVDFHSTRHWAALGFVAALIVPSVIHWLRH